MRLTGYVRVSTDQQGDGFGPDTQRMLCTEWAEREGHAISGWCEDIGVPGTIDALERDGLLCVVEKIEQGLVDGVVMSDPDRLGRRLVVSEAAIGIIRRAGGRVFTVSSGEINDEEQDETKILIRQVLGAISEFEARKIAKRLALGREMKAAAGGYAGYGSPEFGKTSNPETKELVAEPNESAVIEMMLAMQADGLSFRAIAERLNSDGVPSKRGGKWHPTTVVRVLNRATPAVAS